MAFKPGGPADEAASTGEPGEGVGGGGAGGSSRTSQGRTGDGGAGRGASRSGARCRAREANRVGGTNRIMGSLRRGC